MIEDATTYSVVVVGAGPGGIAAAVTAGEAGQRVCLIDDAPFAGGQIWRNRGEVASDRAARHWLARLDRVATFVTRLNQSRVVARLGPTTLLVETPRGPLRLSWMSLVLATGARELFLPFPGWTLPGVIGAGGMQALVKQGLPIAGRRVVVAGSGPLLLAVASLLRSKGAAVPAIIEQAPGGRINRFGVSLVRSPAKLLAAVSLRGRLLGTKYATDSYPTSVAAHSSGGLRLTYRCRGAEASIDCDYLACGFNLIPNNELPQLLECELSGGFVRVDGQLRTTVPGVFAVGEATGIGGVEKAIIEGRIAAHTIAGQDHAAARLARGHAATIDFVRQLDRTFALRQELLALARPDTVVCRCEDVRWSAIERTTSSRQAKLHTRCGMGVCQGRVCGPALERIMRFDAPLVRPPIFATTIGTLVAASTPGGEGVS